MKIEKEGLKDDNGKLRFDLITPECIIGIVECLTLGAKKYKPNSWQNVENPIDTHFASLMRHLIAWRQGEIIDKETGLSHMKHVLSNGMFLLYNEKYNKGVFNE